MKVIAVNYDSGFQSEFAKVNMKNSCKRLGVPLVIMKIDVENQKKMLRESLHMSEALRTFFSMCGNCEANIRVATINVARKYEVPVILYGSSATEDMGAPPFIGIGGFISKTLTRNVADIARVLFHGAKYCYHNIRQRIEMNIPLKYKFVPGQLVPCQIPFPKEGVERINFFDYVRYELSTKVDTIKDYLGWKSPSDRPHRFDCLLHCFVNHHWLQASGISLDGYNYSTLIRENLMERAKAILLEEIIEERLEDECLEMMRKIGLTRDNERTQSRLQNQWIALAKPIHEKPSCQHKR
jgi:hypothetical protein